AAAGAAATGGHGWTPAAVVAAVAPRRGVTAVGRTGAARGLGRRFARAVAREGHTAREPEEPVVGGLRRRERRVRRRETGLRAAALGIVLRQVAVARGKGSRHGEAAVRGARGPRGAARLRVRQPGGAIVRGLRAAAAGATRVRVAQGIEVRVAELEAPHTAVGASRQRAVPVRFAARRGRRMRFDRVAGGRSQQGALDLRWKPERRVMRRAKADVRYAGWPGLDHVDNVLAESIELDRALAQHRILPHELLAAADERGLLRQQNGVLPLDLRHVLLQP
ncbi:hypothetical protein CAUPRSCDRAFT_11372, partial [Caulochytrium protostelioides]